MIKKCLYLLKRELGATGGTQSSTKKLKKFHFVIVYSDKIIIG